MNTLNKRRWSDPGRSFRVSLRRFHGCHPHNGDAPLSMQGYLYSVLAAPGISMLVRLLAGVDASDVQQRLRAGRSGPAHCRSCPADHNQPGVAAIGSGDRRRRYDHHPSRLVACRSGGGRPGAMSQASVDRAYGYHTATRGQGRWHRRRDGRLRDDLQSTSLFATITLI